MRHVEKAFDFAHGRAHGVMRDQVRGGMTGVSMCWMATQLGSALSTEPKFEAMLEGALTLATKPSPRGAIRGVTLTENTGLNAHPHPPFPTRHEGEPLTT